MRDLDGLPAGGDTAAVDAWNQVLVELAAASNQLGDRLAELLLAAPSHVMGRSLRAVVAQPFGLPLDPRSELAAVDLRAGSDRERSFAAAAAIFVDRPSDAAAPLLDHLQAWPADTAASFPAYLAVMASGDRDLIDRYDSAVLEQHRRSPSWRTAPAAGFVLQEQGRYDAAGELAVTALSDAPRCALAAHVLTHCYYETGQHGPGRAWLDSWRAAGDFALYPSHFAWHSALHALAVGDVAAAEGLLAEEIADQAVPDVGSLRWRLRLADIEPPSRPAASRAAYLAARDRGSPLLIWCAATGAAADGDLDSLTELRRLAVASAGPGAERLAGVVSALADAVSGEWARCGDRLGGLTATEARELGGSRAQRQVIDDTRAAALLRSGRYDEARALLEARLNRPPLGRMSRTFDDN